MATIITLRSVAGVWKVPRAKVTSRALAEGLLYDDRGRTNERWWWWCCKSGFAYHKYNIYTKFNNKTIQRKMILNEIHALTFITFCQFRKSTDIPCKITTTTNFLRERRWFYAVFGTKVTLRNSHSRYFTGLCGARNRCQLYYSMETIKVSGEKETRAVALLSRLLWLYSGNFWIKGKRGLLHNFWTLLSVLMTGTRTIKCTKVV